MASIKETDATDAHGVNAVGSTSAPSIQLSAIVVSLKDSAKGSPTIRIIVNGETKLKRTFRSNERTLRWNIKPALFLHEKSNLTIQYERTVLWPKKIVAKDSISFENAQDLLSQESGECKGHKLMDDPQITIDFASSNGLHLNALEKATEVLSQQKSLLERLGKSRTFLETVLGIGNVIAGMDPIANAVLECVNVVYKRLEEQEVHNKLLLDLVDNMACTLGYVEDVEQFARLEGLKAAMEDAKPLVEATTNFVLKDSSRGELARTARFLLSSSDEDQVIELASRFERFKERFDRGVSVQAAATLDQSATTLKMVLALIESNRDDIVLARLKPKDLEYCSPIGECMDGTRQDILAKIDEWATDFEAPNILWITGHPGIGKSAIASSLVEHLRQTSRLGSNFFFQRARAAAMTPNALWRTVAYDLARQYPLTRKHLVSTLNANETIHATVNVDTLFRELIHEPLMASDGIPVGRLPIVVIDALDECGGLEGQHSEDRRSLVATLKSWSRLSNRFKIVVTSRGESDIERLFSETAHYPLEIPAGETVTSQSSEDIRKFLKKELRQIAAPYPSLLASGWPGDETIETLTTKAAGLFIWAKTVIKFVTRGAPKRKLTEFLKGSGVDGMATLYSWILNAAFPSPSEEETSSFRSLIGAIILAKVPLSASSFEHLLLVESDMMEYILNGLQSVVESRDILHINHQSFVDFLIDPNECPPMFHIELKHVNGTLSTACLQVMKIHLKFNICDLKSSYLRNSDIPDLTARIETLIPPHLSYSCCFWASHLAETIFNIQTFNLLEYFIAHQFLFWLEVLSLLKRVNLGSSMMRLLVDWIRTSHQDETMVTDMQKFVAAFASVISQSAPHIYISALPFAPRNSAVSKQYKENYRQTPAIESGGQSDWPSIQNILYGHSKQITSVTFSHDGRFIASGSWDQTVRVWDTETGEVVAGPFEGHTDWVNSVAFSPDGRRIVSGSHDRTIRVWDTDTGEMVVGPFEGHTGRVRSVAFSLDGRYIASGSSDRTIRVWDAKTGEVAAGPFGGQTNSVVSVAFSPDGKRILSGSEDEKIRVWDIATGEMVAGPFEVHTNQVSSVAFSLDGRYIASGSTDMTIRVWDTETGEAVAGPFEGHTDGVRSVAFSLDGRYIASGSTDMTIRVWDAKTGEVVAGPFEGHTNYVNSVAFSPDGKRIISGSDDETIRVWNVETGEVVPGPFEGHTDWVRAVALSQDGRLVVSGSDDKTIGLWDAETGEMVAGPFEGHTGWVNSVAFSPDGGYITSGSKDGTIRVWDAKTGEVVAGPFEGHANYVNSVAFSPDGKRIISGSNDKTIRVWDAKTGEVVAGPFEGHTGWVKSVAFSPDGKRIISSSSDKTIRVWDAKTGEVVGGPFEGHANSVISAVFSPDGKRIISGSEDKTIRVWDTATGEAVAGPFEGHTNLVVSVAFSPDGTHIASGSEDKTVRVWDAETGAVVAGPFEGHTDSVNSVVFSQDGRRIISGSGDSTIRVWDVKMTDPSNLTRVSPTFNDNSKLDDGWILGPKSELLFWVPPAIRTGLWRPSNRLILGRVIKTKLDLKHFVHGEDWSRCKDPPE